MARRDRRRRGAHSASRTGDGSSASALDDGGETVADEPAARPATAADHGTPLTRKDRRAAARSGSLLLEDADRRNKTGKKKGKRSWLDRVLLAGVIVVSLALVAVRSELRLCPPTVSTRWP